MKNFKLCVFLLNIGFSYGWRHLKESGHGIISGRCPRSVTPGTYVEPSDDCGTKVYNCTETVYRSFDGSCNNLNNTSWGTPNTPYNRLLSTNYADGISEPTKAVSGDDLPSARLLSTVFSPGTNVSDLNYTLVNMQYGQLIVHDMSLILNSSQGAVSLNCCSSDGQLQDPASLSPRCYPIEVPSDDPLYEGTGVNCMNFVRTITDLELGCAEGNVPAQQLTSVSAYLDLHVIYGLNADANNQLREFVNGRLITVENNGQIFPPNVEDATSVCFVDDPDAVCYLAGDPRVNQNPELTVLQVIWLREHNRIANILAELNPQWDDETIFQEARRIAIAQHQKIVYYDWIPIFLGASYAQAHNLTYDTTDYVNDYSESVNPSVLNEHAMGGSRYFHTLIQGSLELVAEDRVTVNGELRLSDYFEAPGIIEEGDNFDDLVRSLSSQPENGNDQFFNDEITQYLFRDGNPRGLDLRASDIQRNRDHGLASYNDYRVYCGLPKANTFLDLLDTHLPNFVTEFILYYESVDDLELVLAGSLETHVPDLPFMGPTFLCIMTEQFNRTRRGDRFFFENEGAGFTLDQLNELRKASVARLFCDNADSVTEMQANAFQQISLLNILQSCDDLPSVNLTLWQVPST